MRPNPLGLGAMRLRLARGFVAGRFGVLPYALRARRIAVLIAWLAAVAPTPAAAWGYKGHQVTGYIAARFLDPQVRERVNAMLAADSTGLTATDIANETTWADRYRDSDRDRDRQHYLGTREWHYVNIEIGDPDLDRACYGHPLLPAGMPASRGPAHACIVDKIGQFTAELANPATDPNERLLALQFLLHLVGDVHQPLHAADDHDAGGNRKRISAGGLGAENLHELFDVELVERLGDDPQHAAAALVERISPEQRHQWSAGDAAGWAMETFAVARDDVYRRLPTPGDDGSYSLPASYIDTVARDVAVQLSKAGVRLAFVLNNALAGEQPKR